MDEAGRIFRNLKDPPVKDTVAVPDGGFTIVRLHANNPGFWLIHCHMSWHNHLGMALVLQVGGLGDMPPRPKGFPTCNNYVG